jgi:dephospho-CoA kinase
MDDTYTEALVILLSGWAGSGKDTVAEILVNDHGFQRFAFADPLKEDVSRRTGIPIAIFHDPEHKDLPWSGRRDGKSPRDLLIDRAAAVRAADPDYYARAIGEQILAEMASTGQRHFVISDWRYRREYEYMRNLPGIRRLCTRVERPEIVPSAHQSEHDLDNDPVIKVVLTNDGSLADLRETVRYYLQIYPATAN